MNKFKKLAAPVAGIALVAAGLASAAATDPIPNPLPNAVAGNVIKASDINDIATAVGILDERTDGISRNGDNFGFGNILSPDMPVSVGGSIKSSGYNQPTTGEGTYLAYTNNGGILYAYDYDSGVVKNLSLGAGGNVGIGTTNPLGKLHISAQSPILILESSQTTSQLDESLGKIDWKTKDASAVGSVASIDVLDENNFGSAFGMSFSTGSVSGMTERMRINATGNLKVADLSGTGNAYVCVNDSGTLYRSATACN